MTAPNKPSEADVINARDSLAAWAFKRRIPLDRDEIYSMANEAVAHACHKYDPTRCHTGGALTWLRVVGIREMWKMLSANITKTHRGPMVFANAAMPQYGHWRNPPAKETDRAMRQHLRVRISQAMKRMPRRRRRIVHMLLCGLTHREIAAKLGVTVGAIYQSVKKLQNSHILLHAWESRGY